MLTCNLNFYKIPTSDTYESLSSNAQLFSEWELISAVE